MTTVRPHGHRETYRSGCRCRPCTDANTASTRRYRARRAANGGPLRRHPAWLHRVIAFEVALRDRAA